MSAVAVKPDRAPVECAELDSSALAAGPIAAICLRDAALGRVGLEIEAHCYDRADPHRRPSWDEIEELLTEVSCKFRPQAVTTDLAAAGLRRIRWWTDHADDFGLSLAVKGCCG